jgi:hypothetical protein
MGGDSCPDSGRNAKRELWRNMRNESAWSLNSSEGSMSGIVLGPALFWGPSSRNWSGGGGSGGTRISSAARNGPGTRRGSGGSRGGGRF